jgi:hypothetical protein
VRLIMSQVRLAQYDPEDVLDESVLGTESYDVGDGFRCIRMVNSIYLNLDALGGIEENRGEGPEKVTRGGK